MIEEKIKFDIEFFKHQIDELNELVDCLENKKTETEEFKKYKLIYFSMLNDKIPRRMGSGSERFRELRKTKINEMEILKNEFNEYFNI
jgi:hypothetical protein